MPFIDVKLTMSVPAEQQEELKAALGKAVTTLHKTESYLMVGLTENCPLWLGGKKLEKGAYVAVSLYGAAPASAYDKMTGQICDILQKQFGIPGNAVYVTYHPVENWGFDGRNF